MNTDENKKFLQHWLTQHQGLLSKVLRTHAFTQHDQEDLLQEITFQLWKSIATYTTCKEEVAETTWIYRVALYTAIGWTRKEKTHRRRKQSLDGSEHLLTQPVKSTDKRLEWLYERIAELNDADRSLTIMMLDGCSYTEMATVMGITENHVGVKINRIKKMLNKQLKEKQNHEL